MRCRCQLDLDQSAFAIAAVAMAVVEHGAEDPLLCPRIPIRPSIAAHLIAAADSADNRDALVVVCHSASLAGSVRRSKGWRVRVGPMR
jgi:hypothetical protein